MSLESKFLAEAAAKTVVIVDGYSSGNSYAPRLRRAGYRVLHVQSTVEIPAVYAPSFRKGDYDHCFVHDPEKSLSLVAMLDAFEPTAVIVGTGCGVNFADWLGEALHLRGNGTAQSPARRDKYLMQEAVRAAGLRAIPQKRLPVSATAEALDWCETRYPVLVRPLTSTGTDNAFLCRSTADLEKALSALRDSTNENILLQAFLIGTEYVVDTVSRDGETYVTDLWRYKKLKEGMSVRYDRADLLPFTSDDGIQEKIIAYAKKVLRALRIDQGAAHMEVLLDATGEPVLIEVGARVCGASAPILVEECIGLSQIDLTLDAFLSPERFAERTATPFVLKTPGIAVNLISDRSGKLLDLPRLPDLRRLPSYFWHRLGVQPGGALSVTKDLFTSPGIVFLRHKDPAVIEADYATIRRWEQEDFYRL